MKQLSTEDIMQKVKGSVFTQNYSQKPLIDGVKIIELKLFNGEDGNFEELLKLDEKGNSLEFPEFQLRQINRSRLLSKAVKAWHLHYNQEDIWYVAPEDHMILGLWDVREASSTKDLKMRVVMGGGKSKLVYIPRGVAHGVVNVASKSGTIIYFVNQHYNLSEPDEHRLSWDAAGKEFWEMEKG